MQSRTMAPVVYDRTGAGEPLLLIHGIGHRRQAWRPVIDLLDKQFDVISIDLPGFGESPPMPADMIYDLQTTVDVLAEFLDSVGVHRPHAVGNSLGGAIALELADRDLVQSVTALSPAGFWSPRERAYAIRVLRAHRRSAHLPEPMMHWLSHRGTLRRYVGRMIFEHPERMTDEEFVADALAMRTGQAFEPTIAAGRAYRCMANPTVPTTVAWGEHDHILPPHQMGLARAQIPQARFELLMGCGHVPMFDDPSAVAAVIASTARR